VIEIIFMAMGMISGYAFAKNGLVGSSPGNRAKSCTGQNEATESEVERAPTPPANRGSSIIASGPQKCPQCGHFHDEPLECQKSLNFKENLNE